jgi:hypothetical protein
MSDTTATCPYSYLGQPAKISRHDEPEIMSHDPKQLSYGTIQFADGKVLQVTSPTFMWAAFGK